MRIHDVKEPDYSIADGATTDCAGDETRIVNLPRRTGITFISLGKSSPDAEKRGKLSPEFTERFGKNGESYPHKAIGKIL